MFIIQSEEKERNLMGLLTNIKIIFVIWKSHEIFYSFIPTYYYWNNKHGNVKENASVLEYTCLVFLRFWFLIFFSFTKCQHKNFFGSYNFPNCYHFFYRYIYIFFSLDLWVIDFLKVLVMKLLKLMKCTIFFFAEASLSKT